MAICLSVVAGCAAGYTEYGNTTATTVSIVFVFLFGSVFACGYTPMQPIYPAEVVSNKIRAKAIGTFELTAGAAGFLNTFVGPIALSSIGYWFYMFFVFWDTFEMTFMYFFFSGLRDSHSRSVTLYLRQRTPERPVSKLRTLVNNLL